MIDHKIDRDERFDDLRVASEPLDRAAHRGEIDNQRHAGEILQNDARDYKWDFLICGRFCVPIRQRLHIFASDFFAVVIAQYRFEHDTNAHRQPRNLANTLFLQRRQRMQERFVTTARVECFERFEFVSHAGG